MSRQNRAGREIFGKVGMIIVGRNLGSDTPPTVM